ncbi:putative symporter YagG [compost metagenome]
MGLFFKVGFTLGGAVPLWFLAAYGFDGDADRQTAGALAGINMTAIWIPAALAVVSMIVMHFYPLSDKDVERINKQLDEKRADVKATEA